MTRDAFDQQRTLLEALDRLQSALDLLDGASAPAHIGAQVDLAIHQLASVLGANDVAMPQRAERHRGS